MHAIAKTLKNANCFRWGVLADPVTQPEERTVLQQDVHQPFRVRHCTGEARGCQAPSYTRGWVESGNQRRPQLLRSGIGIGSICRVWSPGPAQPPSQAASVDTPTLPSLILGSCSRPTSRSVSTPGAGMKTLIELGAYLLQHARQHLEVLAVRRQRRRRGGRADCIQGEANMKALGHEQGSCMQSWSSNATHVRITNYTN